MEGQAAGILRDKKEGHRYPTRSTSTGARIRPPFLGNQRLMLWTCSSSGGLESTFRSASLKNSPWPGGGGVDPPLANFLFARSRPGKALSPPCDAARRVPQGMDFNARYRERQYPWRLDRLSRSSNRAPSGALSRSTPPTMARPASRRVSLEVGGVEPPSPSAHDGRLQVCPAFLVVEEGVAGRRASPLVSRF